MTIDDSPKFSSEDLKKMILDQEYNFPDSHFEPSNNEIIPDNKCTLTALEEHLRTYYGTGGKLANAKDVLKKIIDQDLFQGIIENNKSEYLKILALISTLSVIKRGWFNLFLTNDNRTTKPSLSDHPSRHSKMKSKRMNDAIIHCFYNRLVEGFSEDEKKLYKILLPLNTYTAKFDFYLLQFDKVVQDVFHSTQQNIPNYQNEQSLPDLGLDKAIDDVKKVIYSSVEGFKDYKYTSDDLRATVMKFASLNRAINDIDAILAIHDKILSNFPDNIEKLIGITSESQIKTSIQEIYQIDSKKIPEDLIQCAKLVCKIYITGSKPPVKSPDTLAEFEGVHMSPENIAVSAALLYHDFTNKTKLNLLVSGEQNPNILIYKFLSDLSQNKTFNSKELSRETLWDFSFPEVLIKFLTTRYSLSMFGLSSCYNCRVGAKAHLRVRTEKLLLQKELYEKLKELRIEDIEDLISSLVSDLKFVSNLLSQIDPNTKQVYIKNHNNVLSVLVDSSAIT